jgi:regulator of replication initiation timing
MRKGILAGLIPTLALAVTLTACQDTKARQENDQLRSQVAELQKENNELNSRVDSLTKDNAALKDENEKLKVRHVPAKTSKTKHRRRTRH